MLKVAYDVYLLDLKQALQRCQCSHTCGPCVFCRCRTYLLPMEPVVSIFRSSRSNAERNHCLPFFSTVALILSQNFYQNLVLINNMHPYISRWLIEYCHTGNFVFPVLILKRGSEKLLGSCCSELQNLFQRRAS